MLDVLLFFFKQKTAYEMRISDWSSDVCSSDLLAFASPALELIDRLDEVEQPARGTRMAVGQEPAMGVAGKTPADREHTRSGGRTGQIERASFRERVCQYV